MSKIPSWVETEQCWMFVHKDALPLVKRASVQHWLNTFTNIEVKVADHIGKEAIYFVRKEKNTFFSTIHEAKKQMMADD